MTTILTQAVKGKLTSLTLLVFTATYSVTLYLSLHRYNVWVQELTAIYEARGIPSGYIDPNPYYITFEGRLLIGFGVALAIAWLISIFACALRGGKYEKKPRSGCS